MVSWRLVSSLNVISVSRKCANSHPLFKPSCFSPDTLPLWHPPSPPHGAEAVMGWRGVRIYVVHVELIIWWTREPNELLLRLSRCQHGHITDIHTKCHNAQNHTGHSSFKYWLTIFLILDLLTWFYWTNWNESIKELVLKKKEKIEEMKSRIMHEEEGSIEKAEVKVRSEGGQHWLHPRPCGTELGKERTKNNWLTLWSRVEQLYGFKGLIMSKSPAQEKRH